MRCPYSSVCHVVWRHATQLRKRLNETARFSRGMLISAPPSAPFYRGSTGAAPGVLGSGFNFASNSFINVPAVSAFNLNTPLSFSFVPTLNNNAQSGDRYTGEPIHDSLHMEAAAEIRRVRDLVKPPTRPDDNYDRARRREASDA